MLRVGVLAGVTKIRGKLGKKEWKKIITKCGAGCGGAGGRHKNKAKIREKERKKIIKRCGAGCGGAGGDSSVDAADATRS